MRNVWEDDVNSSQLLWRYFKTSRFLSFLKSASLYFTPLTQFADPFEGAVAVIPHKFIDPRYVELDFEDKAFRDLKEYTNVNCWHQAKYESYAMWRLYAEESKGVVISSTLSHMRSAIAPFVLRRNPNPKNFGSVRSATLISRRSE